MEIGRTQPTEPCSYHSQIEAGDWSSVLERDKGRFRRLARRTSLRFPALQEADCEDIVQNTVIKILQKRDSFDFAKGTYEAWSHQICIREIYDVLRELRKVGKLRQWQPDLSEEEPEEWLDRMNRTPEPGGDLDSRLMAEELLESLDPEKRQILRLKHWEGMSVEEIAELFGSNPATIKQRIYRAAQELRRILTEPCVESSERAKP